jgi:hypothetical protein
MTASVEYPLTNEEEEINLGELIAEKSLAVGECAACVCCVGTAGSSSSSALTHVGHATRRADPRG